MVKHAGKGAGDFTARDFRDALSTFATGVTIVTTQDAQGGPVGMTASSFNSVSTEPPLVLWSVAKTAFSAPIFKSAKFFAIHVLATDQTDLSNQFARSGEDKFANIDYAQDENGVPVLTGCATRFDCRSWAVYEGGDHWVIVGQVETIDRAKKEGLVFGGGAYSIAAPLTTIDKTAVAEAGKDGAIEGMLFYHLSRAYHQMGHQFHEAVRDAGLTLAEWRILANLHSETSLTNSELAARTFLDPQSLSDVLTSLQEDGLCKLGSRDGAPLATGTPSGTQRVEPLLTLNRQIEEAVLDQANGGQRDELIRQLKTIVSNTEPRSSGS